MEEQPFVWAPQLYLLGEWLPGRCSSYALLCTMQAQGQHPRHVKCLLQRDILCGTVSDSFLPELPVPKSDLKTGCCCGKHRLRWKPRSWREACSKQRGVPACLLPGMPSPSRTVREEGCCRHLTDRAYGPSVGLLAESVFRMHSLIIGFFLNLQVHMKYFTQKHYCAHLPI